MSHSSNNDRDPTNPDATPAFGVRMLDDMPDGAAAHPRELSAEEFFDGVTSSLVRRGWKPPPTPPPPQVKNGTLTVARLGKIVGGTLAVALTVGAVIWSAAALATSKVDRGELNEVIERVESIERNDIRQTVILERIDKRVEKLVDDR